MLFLNRRKRPGWKSTSENRPTREAKQLLSKCPAVKMLCCQNVLLSKCSAVRMSCCQNALLSKCSVVKMSCCQNALLSKCSAVKMLCCQNVLLSKCSAVKMLCCQNVLLSKCSAVKVSCSQGWCYTSTPQTTWPLWRQRWPAPAASSAWTAWGSSTDWTTPTPPSTCPSSWWTACQWPLGARLARGLAAGETPQCPSPPPHPIR